MNLTGGLKRKLGYISKFFECTHVCIGVKELVDLSTESRAGVRQFDPPMQKLHCVSLTKRLASEMARECRIGAVALEVDGCPS